MHRTDWLGSNLVFYNEVTGAIGSNLPEVASGVAEIDLSGLDLYLKYGFSPLGMTPIKGVRYTPPNSNLFLDSNGNFSIVEVEDPILQYLGKTTPESEAAEEIERWGATFYSEVDTQNELVILPLSGGLDSRHLAHLSRGRNEVRAFSYGVTLNQRTSDEILSAARVASVCGLSWQRIPLGKYHEQLSRHDKAYGLSTHAHSMYHMEFFHSIRGIVGRPGGIVLSGILGDVWAGSWEFPKVRTPADISKLALTHGINAGELCSNPLVSDAEELFFENHKTNLLDPMYRVVAAARIKMILLRHLIETPLDFGFSHRSPFLDLDVAWRMLTVTPSRRKNRLWHRDYLESAVPLGKVSNRKSDSNLLDLWACFVSPPPSLTLYEPLPPEIRHFPIREISDAVRVRGPRFIAAWLEKSLPMRFPRLLALLKRTRGRSKTSFGRSYTLYTIIYPLVSHFSQSNKVS